ncbi:hypothetical protein Pint_20175 [Pistacia integerrima]|uniref:Uncharacterized protein n=1 Tax=Pistacia integerrima TaxID=434235 RepID=A0ACC0XEC7_9ROSI|nr:hypothetical protein Pint_20175 [Pistacia integerrima]
MNHAVFTQTNLYRNQNLEQRGRESHGEVKDNRNLELSK